MSTCQTKGYLSFTSLLVVATSLCSSPIDIGHRREIFMDTFLIESMTNAAQVLQPPVDEGVVFRFDQPWEGKYSVYSTVIRDEVQNKFLMYYRGQPDTISSVATCMAESTNGIDWIRPNFGLYVDAVGGRTNNNIVIYNDPACADSFAPFLDTHPNTLPSERFKATASALSVDLVGYTSADGIHWENIGMIMTSPSFAFDSLNVAFYSETEQQYVCYYRTWDKGRRRISRAVSSIFSNFTDQGVMSYTYPNGTLPCGEVDQLYTSGTHPYCRAPHQFVALAGKFVDRSDPCERNYINTNDPCHAVFMTTRPGYQSYERLFPGPYFTPAAELLPQQLRSNYPTENTVQTGPRELSFYVGHKYTETNNHLRRYSLRLDGFVALSSTNTDFAGEVVTKAIRLNGEHLLLNYRCREGGRLQVEFQDEAGTPIPGRTLNDSIPLTGDEIDGIAFWNNGKSIAALSNTPVKVRFVIQNADLFSMNAEVSEPPQIDSDAADDKVWTPATNHHFTWSAQKDSGSGIEGYSWALNGFPDTNTVQLSDASLLITNVPLGTNEFRVCAKSRTGIWSAPGTFHLCISTNNIAPNITEGPLLRVFAAKNRCLSIRLHARDENATLPIWSIISPASHGTAFTDGVGTAKDITYEPNTNYWGRDGFTVQVSDGFGGSDIIGIDVTVGGPQWWVERGVLTNNPSANYTPANRGQLKWIASMAYQEFQLRLTNDLTAISNLVSSFANTNSHLAINLGQLKATAQPFYDVLTAHTNMWPLGMTAGPYPWSDSTNASDNYSPANLGQLKNVFSFDLSRTNLYIGNP